MSERVAIELNGENTDEHRHRILKEEIDSALEQICEKHMSWLYKMFFLAALPGVWNGMNLMAYVFYVDTKPFYCKIPELEQAGWTGEQIRGVSVPNAKTALEYGCEYYDFDYSQLADQSYLAVQKWVNLTKDEHRTLPCKDFRFEDTNSVVSEWNLVCDRFIYRSNIQAVYAVGKILGASFFGIISDKYGRRFSFTMAALCYVISALLAPFTKAYLAFLLARFLIGMSGVGCYYSIYTLLNEILVGKQKTWICCIFNASYPIGMILLSVIAYYIPHWQSLQIIMSVPSIVLPLFYWVLPESPLWLLSKDRHEDAWKVIRKIDDTLKPTLDVHKIGRTKHSKKHYSLGKKIALPFAKFAAMFSTHEMSKRSLVCFFSWFTVSSVYNGLALNGENFNLEKHLYTLVNGVLEILSYLAPIPMLNTYGRKACSMLLFLLIGVSLLSIMFLPRSLSTAILIMASLGRFCNSSLYVVLALHTAELFPTTIRNTAIGASSTMSHIGSLCTPYIVDLFGAVIWYIPSTIFGSLCICAIFLLTLLPETRDKPMYNTVDEMTRAEAEEKDELMLNQKSDPPE